MQSKIIPEHGSDAFYDYVLENQDTLRVVWSDPVPGRNQDGEKCSGDVTSFSTVGDCIRFQRFYERKSELSPTPERSERDLLDEFLCVRWATVKIEKNE